MLTVKVELNSAITGRTTEIARMHIWNDGSSDSREIGNYGVRTYRGRNSDTLDKYSRCREGYVLNHRRLKGHVWNLVAKALKSINYGEKA